MMTQVTLNCPSCRTPSLKCLRIPLGVIQNLESCLICYINNPIIHRVTFLCNCTITNLICEDCFKNMFYNKYLNKNYCF